MKKGWWRDKETHWREEVLGGSKDFGKFWEYGEGVKSVVN